ncbi:YdbH domain-containing protein [uncultured Photobacterium sp.]|uniref:intermembrane phospholipid transport protein YdbH family protein n=1 Tax=uncultured Photobacterium sp. TaxID=173973 RepID=UPI00262BE438|nr:YdbH domain-containing protein [uncultured Photobacterium sp.]
MNETEKQLSTAAKGKKRYRKLRLFIYGLCILLCMLIIPAVIIPPWLASKGIEINAISGISFSKGLVIDELSIAINKNALTFKKLSLEHFVDEDSAISNSSWRLFSPKTEIILSPAVFNALRQRGIKLSALSFSDTAFNFTDLSEPYVFSAHTSQLNASLFDKNNHPILQQINDINLVLTTQPTLVISGFARQADLSLLIPRDEAENRYPLSLESVNFSISWQPERTPLSVHIENLTPKWPTTTDGYNQSGRNIALELDLKHAADSIKLTADHLWVDQPSQLPEFIEKPDNSNQGLHLGRAIGQLSMLPIRKLKIDDFSYGELIIHSLLVLETPRKRENKPDKHAKLKLTGKALGPEPYDIDILLKHRSEQDAHFSGKISGPKGNDIQCNADFYFASPLPQSLSCSVTFNNTKELTDRLKFHGIPSAVLHSPLKFTATQTALKQNTSQQATVDALSHSRLIDIAGAEYQIALTLPNKVDLALNQFAFHHPMLSPSEQEQEQFPVSTLAFQTDGSLNLRAQYQDGTLRLNLAEPTEQVIMTSPQHNSLLSLQLKQLTCSLQIDLPTISESLQCHTDSYFKGKLSQLFPVTEAKLETISASSDIALQWSANDLAVQLKNTEITLDKATLSLHPELINTEITDLSLNVASIKLAQVANTDTPDKKRFQLLPESAIILSGDIYGEKVIMDETLSSTERKTLLHKKNRLPVQKYSANVELKLTNTSLFQASEQLEIDTHYQISLNLKQNNQRLPSLGSNGKFSLSPNMLRVSGELKNIKQARLIQFTVSSNMRQQKTRIQLHRNDISFNPKRTLQKHYLPHLPVDYDLNNGKLSFDADLIIKQDTLTGEFSIFADALSGNAHDFHFADLNASVTAGITPHGIRSKHPIGIHIGLLHAGVLLENIFALIEFDSEKNHYALHRASAYTLGGSISTHGVTSSQLANIPYIPILVHHLDLEKLIQAIEPEDIELTGVLDGRFPISIHDGMPVIKNGALHSRYPGGILRYKEGSAIDQNIEAADENSLLVISKILKNYKYDSLAVDIDYSKEGQLNASSRFKGHNPDFQNGRPVNVNLNIEDDIPALIKTLNVINSSKLESLFLKQLGLNE